MLANPELLKRLRELYQAFLDEWSNLDDSTEDRGDEYWEAVDALAMQCDVLSNMERVRYGVAPIRLDD